MHYSKKLASAILECLNKRKTLSTAIIARHVGHIVPSQIAISRYRDMGGSRGDLECQKRKGSKAIVSNALSRMYRDGKIARMSRGVYGPLAPGEAR